MMSDKNLPSVEIDEAEIDQSILDDFSRKLASGIVEGEGLVYLNLANFEDGFSGYSNSNNYVGFTNDQETGSMNTQTRDPPGFSLEYWDNKCSDGYAGAVGGEAFAIEGNAGTFGGQVSAFGSQDDAFGGQVNDFGGQQFESHNHQTVSYRPNLSSQDSSSPTSQIDYNPVQSQVFVPRRESSSSESSNGRKSVSGHVKSSAGRRKSGPKGTMLPELKELEFQLTRKEQLKEKLSKLED